MKVDAPHPMAPQTRCSPYLLPWAPKSKNFCNVGCAFEKKTTNTGIQNASVIDHKLEFMSKKLSRFRQTRKIQSDFFMIPAFDRSYFVHGWSYRHVAMPPFKRKL